MNIPKNMESYNMSKERFTVEECSQCSDDRKFQNNKCVYNNRLGFAYSVDEIVEVLNHNGRFGDMVWDLMQNKIWYMQGMYNRTSDEKYKVHEEMLKELREELYNPAASSEKYDKVLEEWFLELKKEKE